MGWENRSFLWRCCFSWCDGEVAAHTVEVLAEGHHVLRGGEHGDLGAPTLRHRPMTYQLINLIGFNAGWFACVLSAAGGVPWAGLIGIAALVGLHLRMMPHPRREIALLFTVTG